MVSTNDRFNDVCKRLDILAITALDLTESILQERENLNASLKNGFLSIAEYRYLKGSQSISIDQMNRPTMVPLKKVIMSEETVNDINCNRFFIVDDDASMENDGQNPVRRRNIKSEVDDVTGAIDAFNLTDNKRKKLEDPLKWFGILTPQCLRNSQASFQESLVGAANIASLQSELQSVCQEYKDYLVQKESLKDTHV